jgi:hypothetical protein
MRAAGLVSRPSRPNVLNAALGAGRADHSSRPTGLACPESRGASEPKIHARTVETQVRTQMIMSGAGGARTHDRRIMSPLL